MRKRDLQEIYLGKGTFNSFRNSLQQYCSHEGHAAPEFMTIMDKGLFLGVVVFSESVITATRLETTIKRAESCAAVEALKFIKSIKHDVFADIINKLIIDPAVPEPRTLTVGNTDELDDLNETFASLEIEGSEKSSNSSNKLPKLFSESSKSSKSSSKSQDSSNESSKSSKSSSKSKDSSNESSKSSKSSSKSKDSSNESSKLSKSSTKSKDSSNESSKSSKSSTKSQESSRGTKPSQKVINEPTRSSSVIKTKTDYSVYSVGNVDDNDGLDKTIFSLKIDGLKKSSSDSKKRPKLVGESTKSSCSSSVIKTPINYSSFPTVDEIRAAKAPPLRPLKKSGSYPDKKTYRDIMFCLLKEDLIRDLREGVKELIRLRGKDHVNTTNLRLYFEVCLLYPVCSINDASGVAFQIYFDTKGRKSIHWENGKFLIYGSLLCFSVDYFRTMIFGTVADSDPKHLTRGFLTVRFQDDPLEVRTYFGQNRKINFVECPSYFESYRYVLDGFRDITYIPLSQFLISCNATVSFPKYLLTQTNAKYDLTGVWNREKSDTKETFKNVQLMKINENCSPLLEGNSTLNESQFQAFMAALKSELCLIQGPPGTGKTYVALNIIETLIKSHIIRQGEPLLLVCYTNHALDQLLKGLLVKGYRNFVRVGGNCDEKLTEYSFAKRRTKINCREKIAIEEMVDPDIRAFERYYHLKSHGQLFDFNFLKQVMLPKHENFFSKKYEKCKKLKVHIFEVFLGLLSPINIHNLDGYTNSGKRSSRNDMRKSHQQFISIKGEGHMLMDRWATNVGCYKRKTNVQFDEYQDHCIKDMKERPVNIATRERIRFEIKKRLQCNDKMEAKEVNRITDLNSLSENQKWRLYRYWVDKFILCNNDEINRCLDGYDELCDELREDFDKRDEQDLRSYDIIAMTTTCAARMRACLNRVGPKIVIIEEAAEVLEAHVVTSLSDSLEQLILIGDHKQLKPNPSVYELATKYHLDLSLFERMINNNIPCYTLTEQHRMRPEIAYLVRHVYDHLTNHDDVLHYPDVKGVQSNLLFFNHHHDESHMESMKTRSNQFEARFITSFCRYLLQQGYERSKITILCAYSGQLVALKNMMLRSDFDGVRVTTVDNFQGEENDIILLSLVRSNQEGKIGFLKAENRICVALSRAKIGLYVFGNFNLLESENDLWKTIIRDARNGNYLKQHVPIVCQNHPNMIRRISKPDDFAKFAPTGTCTKDCDFQLPCGHACAKLCHIDDPSHSKYTCQIKCLKQCAANHTCEEICHFRTKCVCHKKCSRTRKCGHKCTRICSDDCEKFSCSVKCEKIRSCGHKCTRICSDDCEKFSCSVKCEKIRSCGHKCKQVCCDECEKYPCFVQCEKLRSCGHICTGICSGERERSACLQRCNRTRICGHKCVRICSVDCNEFPCSQCENQVSVS